MIASTDWIGAGIGMAGIVVSVGVGFLFFALGKRSQDDLINILQDAADLRVSEPPAGSLPPVPARAAVQARAQEQVAGPESAEGRLIRSSLRVLQNARGEVKRQRLLDEVVRVVGADRLPAVETELMRLRSSGAIDWEGDMDSLSRVAIIQVRPGVIASAPAS